MRSSNQARLAALALGLVLAAPAAMAGDSGTDGDSLFKTKSALQDQRVLLKMKQQIKADEKALGVDDEAKREEPKQEAAAAKAKAPPKVELPPVLTAIIGSNGRFIAVFKLPDGNTLRAEPHQTVPGLGVVRAITGNGLQIANGHWLSVAAGADE
jgi:type IV pilus biogenesis protein PilP